MTEKISMFLGMGGQVVIRVVSSVNNPAREGSS